MPDTNEALKKKLAEVNSKLTEYPETRRIRISLLSKRGAYWSNTFTPAESRIILAAADNHERVEKAREVIKDLLDSSPRHPNCSDLHHVKSSQHSDGDDCPVLVRYYKARNIASALLREIGPPASVGDRIVDGLDGFKKSLEGGE